jgi:hypothetical protein
LRRKSLRILIVFQHNFCFGEKKALIYKKGCFFVPNINYMNFFSAKKAHHFSKIKNLNKGKRKKETPF